MEEAEGDGDATLQWLAEGLRLADLVRLAVLVLLELAVLLEVEVAEAVLLSDLVSLAVIVAEAVSLDVSLADLEWEALEVVVLDGVGFDVEEGQTDSVLEEESVLEGEGVFDEEAVLVPVDVLLAVLVDEKDLLAVLETLIEWLALLVRLEV